VNSQVTFQVTSHVEAVHIVFSYIGLDLGTRVFATGGQTRRIQFRTDTADSEPSGATLPLANARSAWRLGVHGEFRAVGQTRALCMTLSRVPRDNLSINCQLSFHV
jgi:hypothetical protein